MNEKGNGQYGQLIKVIELVSNALFQQRCIKSSNAALHYQRRTISSTLHYIVNDALYHQRCIVLSTLYHIIKTALHCQH